MEDKPIIKYYSTVLDTNEPEKLAEFYAKLLGWIIVYHDEEYTIISAPGICHGAYPGITFQYNPDYIQPVWPDKEDAQRQMAHLDFAVADLNESVLYAQSIGARLAEEQYSDYWRVMFDPSGHPFCLCMQKQIIESAGFALL